jgi:hypothetical protein
VYSRSVAVIVVVEFGICVLSFIRNCIHWLFFVTIHRDVLVDSRITDPKHKFLMTLV